MCNNASHDTIIKSVILPHTHGRGAHPYPHHVCTYICAAFFFFFMEQMLCVRYLANEEKWSAKWYSKTECECACGISTYSLFIVSEKTPIVADHELFLLLRTLRLLPQLLLCSFSLPVFFFFFFSCKLATPL